MNPCNGPNYPPICPIRKTKSKRAWQNSPVQEGAPSFLWWEDELAAALLRVGIKTVHGAAAGRQEHCPIYFPPANFTALYEKEDKHFCPLTMQPGCFTKVIPTAPGEVCSEHLFFPVQNDFLDKVRVQLCSVSAPLFRTGYSVMAQHRFKPTLREDPPLI